MFQPPNSYAPPPPASLTFDHQESRLANQMQNMKLAPPLPQSYPNSSPVMPGALSPQHRSPNSTNVTYSGTPGATYPYSMNNNYSPSSISPSMQQPPTNNNQYSFHGPPPTFSNQPTNKIQSPTVQSFSQGPVPYSNGVSNGHDELKPNPNIGSPAPQHFPQTPSSFASPHPSGQVQYQSQMGQPRTPQPNQPYMSSPMGMGPSSFQRPPSTAQQIPSPQQPGFQPYQPERMGFSPPGPQFSGMPPSPPGPKFSGMPPSPPSAGMPNQPWQGASYQQGAPNNFPYAMGSQNTQPQQPRKLELDQMPSVVQVREEDQRARCGFFTTDAKGVVPPLVTTDFVVQDRGMCSPRFMRSSLYCLPTQPDILKQTAVPFSITISPMASIHEEEKEPPRCLYRDPGPLRCKRCKAYICSFMTFMEGGRCFQCAFCKVVTEVPEDYFCFLDGMGERQDKYHRPELCLGSYEFVATKEYCRNDELPNPPAYIFMIEVSNATFRNGLVPLLCENMKNVLQTLQTDETIDSSKLRVGFVTYNNVLHFYNMKKNLTQPHIMVLSDVHNAFVPLLEGFLVTLSEAEALVDSLMEHIPRLFMNEPATEIILGPVIQVGLEALKNANCSGKLLIFHSTIPNADAPGKLPHREGQKLLGTDKQKTVLAPQTDFYSKLAQDCVAAGCAVDLFLFPAAYIDIASLGPLCRHTGGQMYKYTYFQSHVDGDRFLEDLERNITTPTAFDAVLRVRTSAGISPVFYYGNFYMSNATDIELSAIDCYKSVTIELAYDDKLSENETVYIQAALLYTSCTGERLIRVHNLGIPTSAMMSEVFKCSELDAMINFFAKQALKNLLDQSPQQIKSNLLNRSVKMLTCYRKYCATNTSSGQLILPDALKLLPLMINCLLKSDAIGGGPDISLDDRCYSIIAVNSMDINSTAGYFYPTLIPLHDVSTDAENIPNPIRCSIEKLSDTGAYLLENGMYMFLWIGQAINSEWLQNVIGVQSTNLIDKQKTSLPELNTPLSKRIRQIIEDLEDGRQWYMRLTVMVQGDKLEVVFRQFLVEDRGVDGSPSYVDFLCHLHREISKND